MKLNLLSVVYMVNGTHTKIGYFHNMAHFKAFQRTNENIIELVSYAEI